MTDEHIGHFQETIWNYYASHERIMPWRTNATPYFVLVSEIMLQQTQVSRVMPKFEEFIVAFPTIEDLASSSLDQVLIHWSGLGYNRRAKYLYESARTIVKAGEFPKEIETLKQLPGIGYNTAAAIRNYAFEQATPFVETNIRTVLFHEFYAHTTNTISDKEVLVLVEKTMSTDHPKDWFYALMDYGAMLKASAGGRISQSKHYKKQTPLQGSVREVRGMIVRLLSEEGQLTDSQLRSQVGADHRYQVALQGLMHDGLVSANDGKLSLTGSSQAS